MRIENLPVDAPRQFAEEVVIRLRNAGHQALWAGGCVRDLILGKTPSDYDVATSAVPEDVLLLFRRTVAVGVSFGVVRVLGPKEAGAVEVATFRSDGPYSDGRRPEHVLFGSPEADAARRDFTINGMFLDPLSGEVIDYVGGLADLDAKVLRAIGDPEARFTEDKLRLLRAVRFAARFQLAIDPETKRAMTAMSSQVRQVAVERIAQEMRRMIVHPTRVIALKLALETGLIATILPELLAMRGLPQEKPVLPGGDLWDHTMLVLEKLPPEPSFTLAMAALLHDVGKPSSRGLNEGRMTFYNHEYAGRRIADAISRRLKLANHERERIAWLVESHQLLVEPKKLREGKLKRILTTSGIEELLALHRADALASTGDASHVDYCEWYLREQPSGPIDPPPLLTGHDLVQRGLTPGPNFSSILEQVRDAQLDGLLRTKAEALAWVDQLMKGEGEQGADPN